ncbi:sigma-E factor negative regulatory protein [Curvibacter sp. RS43]|uniref:Sigma-E factor negative regulatory protein n=1 Tax=Curvibacter microcysteis TaxID=3026419 RepID=A0ABT5MG84_9BURK|nr:MULTISPECIES: sigma-E factor negative regulatory protein [unclassified Curvibacter]MDD0810702.1 sigma-E factor negative regulatory protein [Curvibacter sp. RS43]MDD0815563.1 sigma-E factor negative regulatory protein [Curvibacter sp. HBC28]
MDRQIENRELISDLADGRLDAVELTRAMARIDGDEDALLSWEAYHLSRDVLRGEWDEAADPAADLAPDFLSRLRTRLQDEVIAPPEAPVLPMAEPLPPQPQRLEAANQPVFRWRLVAGLATVTAVAAVGWALLASQSPMLSSPQLAQDSRTGAMQTVALSSGERAVMLRDPRLDELLAAHKQAGGSSALQMPAGFLRNATFEGDGR